MGVQPNPGKSPQGNPLIDHAVEEIGHGLVIEGHGDRGATLPHYHDLVEVKRVRIESFGCRATCWQLVE
jgi:hypothetical protein